MPKMKLDTQRIKQLLLEKVEVVALGGAGLIALLLLVSGLLTAFGAGSPDRAIKKSADELKQQIASATPGDLPKDGGKLDTDWGTTRPDAYATGAWYDNNNVGERRKVNPLIHPIDVVSQDGEKRYAQLTPFVGGAFKYVISGGDKILVIRPKGSTEKQPTPAREVRLQRLVLAEIEFNYREQVQEYLKALRITKQEELFAKGLGPTFEGLNVYRGSVVAFRPVAGRPGEFTTDDWVVAIGPGKGDKLPVRVTNRRKQPQDVNLHLIVLFDGSATPVQLPPVVGERPLAGAGVKGKGDTFVSEVELPAANGKQVIGLQHMDWEPVYVYKDGKVQMTKANEILLKEYEYDKTRIDEVGFLFPPLGYADTPFPKLAVRDTYPKLELDGITPRESDKPAVAEGAGPGAPGVPGVPGVPGIPGGTKGAGGSAAGPPGGFKMPGAGGIPGAGGGSAAGPPGGFPKGPLMPGGMPGAGTPADPAAGTTVGQQPLKFYPKPFYDRLTGTKINPFSPYGVFPEDGGKQGVAPGGNPFYTGGAPPSLADYMRKMGSQMGKYAAQAGKGGTGAQAEGAAKGAEAGAGNTATPTDAVPEKVLLRFVDAGLQPGRTYQYSVQVRFKNPNFGKTKEVAYPALAEAKELVSPWVLTQPVTIPQDSYLYVVNQTPTESRPRGASVTIDTATRTTASNLGGKIPFQIHQVVTDVEGQEVCDWVVAERLLIGRGDLVARLKCEVEVPVWNQKRERFELPGVYATTKGKGSPLKAKTGLPVDFGDETSPVLADFWGGRFDEGNTEVLLLNADGTMTLRNSLEDTEADSPIGAERIQRYEAWRDRLHAVRDATAGRQGGPARPGAPGAPAGGAAPGKGG